MPPPDPQSWDDATLARRCAAREETAWRELLRRAGPAAEEAMRRVFRNAGLSDPKTEALEAMGSLATTLLERDAAVLRAYRPEIPLWAYLAVVAHSVACKALRKRHPTFSLEEADLGQAERLVWDEGEDTLPVPPERLQQALQQLDPRERLLLQLVYWEGLSHEEVAKVLGLKSTSIGSLLTRTRAALRELLKIY